MAYKILVIGDSCTDIFQYGKIERICPEAPCPVFVPTYSTTNEGMASNVVANLKAFNGNIEINFITNREKPIKTRYVEEKSNQMIVRIDQNDKINRDADLRGVNWEKYDAVIVSDYDKGFLDEHHLEIIAGCPALTFLDTKKPLDWWAADYNFVKINEHEYKKVKESYIGGNIIITRGSEGAEYRGNIYPSEKVNVMDISGAGDTFLAGLVYKYLQTNSIEESLIFANKCAATVITKRGTSTL